MLYADQGKPAKLECLPPPGLPKPEVLWLIQGNDGRVATINSTRITPGPDGSLYLSHVEIEDVSGTDLTYVCSAMSKYLNKYKIGGRVKLDVRRSRNDTSTTPPIQQYVTPEATVALMGDDIELVCIFGGKPVPQITWKRDGQALQTGYRLSRGRNGKSIELRSVAFNDTGSYTCQAANGVGPMQNHTIHLDVQSKPTILGESTSMVKMASEGDDVTFECKVEGVPKPDVEWQFNSAPLRNSPPNPRRVISGDSLTIVGVLKSDVGSYGCLANNVHGTAMRQGILSVSSVPPTMTYTPVNATIAAGTVAVLHCPVFGVPTPNIQWLHKNESLISARFSQEGDSLKIHNAQASDSGEYTCRASNKFGEMLVRLFLNVKGVFKVTQAPVDRTATPGDWTTFTCTIESTTNDFEVEWEKDGVPISFEVMPRLIRGVDGSLSIFSLTATDAGLYTCVARAGLEEMKASARLTITAA